MKFEKKTYPRKYQFDGVERNGTERQRTKCDPINIIRKINFKADLNDMLT